MTIKHTPTPWHLRDGATNGEVHVCAPGRTIAVCDARPPNECEANAEFIVKAVNSYDDMLEALEALVKYVDALNDVSDEGGLTLCDEYDNAVAAIAKAKGEA